MAGIRNPDDCRFQSFFENAVEGIFQSTPDGHYIDVNPALARMYGYGSPEELMHSVSDITKDIYVDPNIRNEFKQRINKDGFVLGLEYQIRRKDDSVLWICEHARSVKDADGHVLYYEGTIQDITRRKEAENAKSKLEAQLRQSQKMEAIGTLAGGVAHDFNNILTAILGFTELALDHVPPGHDAHPYLEQVMTGGQRARELVKQMLAFGRHSNAEWTAVRLSLVVKEALKLINAGFPKDIRCIKSFHTERDWVMADPNQLHQIIVNLCVNAQHAMRANGGELRISIDLVRNAAEDAISPGLKAGNYIHMSVNDTGHGMSQDVMDRIFEPFFTTKPQGEGTGLGLSVVHGIVASHGGAITVESVVGIGTTFHVYLPAMGRALETPNAEASAPAIPGHGRILYVDDEDMIGCMVRIRLTQLGYRVTTRSDSVEALRTFKKDPHAFDLVITDYSMPNMTGLALGLEIKRLRPEIPMILCSGLLQESANSIANKSLFCDVIMKPFDFPAFSRRIRAIIETAPAHSKLENVSP
jgi:PAS domain S-box-containing protein